MNKANISDLESRISPVQLWRLSGSYEAHRFISGSENRDESYVTEVITSAEKFNPRGSHGYSAKCVVFYDDITAYLFGLDIINERGAHFDPSTGKYNNPKTRHSAVRDFAIELMRQRYGFSAWPDRQFKKGGGFITIDTKIPLILLHGSSNSFGNFYEIDYKDRNKYTYTQPFISKFPVSVVNALNEYARDNTGIGNFRQFPRIFACSQTRPNKYPDQIDGYCLNYDSNEEVDLIGKLLGKKLEIHKEENK